MIIIIIKSLREFANPQEKNEGTTWKLIPNTCKGLTKKKKKKWLGGRNGRETISANSSGARKIINSN